jgi:transcriptional regulator with XRE-family HTH domain
MKKHPILTQLYLERVRQKVSRHDLSTKLGYDYSTLSGWERGERTPTFSALIDWCDSLGVRLSITTNI